MTSMWIIGVDSQTKCDTGYVRNCHGNETQHLEREERCRLRGLMERGLGIGEITSRLSRHRATIHWEIACNRCADGYRPDSAERRAWARKLREFPKFRAVV